MKAHSLGISIVLFIVAIITMVWIGIKNLNIETGFIYCIAGFFSFTLLEYLVHRYLFHLKFPSIENKKWFKAIHGDHHESPKELTAIMMKPSLAIIILAVTTILFYGLFKEDMLFILPGFLLGYSSYLSIHFVIHTYKPPKNVFRLLWKQHTLHHYWDDKTNFGVSSPLWDIVFGTYSVGRAGRSINRQK